MALLARAGDRAGAIRQYRAGVAVLERELGVAPLAETTDLYEAIRDAHGSTSGAEQGPSISPATSVDRGGTGCRPVAAALPERPARLPMVGRDTELAALVAAHDAATARGRVAVLVGEAGIGKSRLAEALAESVSASGGRVLAARAFAAEGTIAYAPIVELLRAGFADAGAPAALAGLTPPTLREIERLVALPPEVVRDLPDAPRDAGHDDQPAARARLLDAIATVLVRPRRRRHPGPGRRRGPPVGGRRVARGPPVPRPSPRGSPGPRRC